MVCRLGCYSLKERDDVVSESAPECSEIRKAARAIAIWMRYGYRAVPLNARDAYAQGLRDGKRSNAAGHRPL